MSDANDLIFGADDLPELDPPGDLTPPTPAAPSAAGVNTSELETLLRELIGRVDAVESQVSKIGPPAEIDRPDATNVASDPVSAPPVPASPATTTSSVSGIGEPPPIADLSGLDIASRPSVPSSVAPTPEVPPFDPAAWQDPPQVTPPAGSAPAEAEPTPVVGDLPPFSFDPQPTLNDLPADVPPGFDAGDVVPAAPPTQPMPLPEFVPVRSSVPPTAAEPPPFTPFDSGPLAPPVDPTPAPVPPVASPYDDTEYPVQQSYDPPPSMVEHSAASQEGGDAAQLMIAQDILAAIANASGESRAIGLNEDAALSELRAATKSEGAARGPSRRPTRRSRGKGGTPSFPSIMTEFQPNRPLVLSFTSPKGGVGKSTTSANVAAMIAKSAEVSGIADKVRVLLVDGDIASGNLAMRLANVIRPNLLDMINDMDERNEQKLPYGDSWERDIKHRVLGHPNLVNLDLLAAPVNPKVLLDLERQDIDTLMSVWAKHYQVIIFDTGIQITDWTNIAWLEYSSQVYLMVEPEMACLRSTSDFARLVHEEQATSQEAFRVVCIRSDHDIGKIPPKQIVSEVFNFVPPQRTFFLSDYYNDAVTAGNAGDFLVLESPEYANELAPIVESAIEAYESQTV